MFTDNATIKVIAGNGGPGLSSFRRERYVDRGGPDGGDGGDGGDIIAEVKDSIHGLSDYRHIKEIKARNGEQGGPQNRHGRSADDRTIYLPKGTLIYEDGKVIADLVNYGDKFIIAKGGQGGYGNAHFKSSTRQAPKVSERGEPGEKRELELELKLIADVGLVGMPNAGKSTFLSVVSNARPKIADYPFTTLVPNLGIADIDGESLVIADIPGLIEGASEGRGLGDEFLRHVERTAVLLHLVDITDDDYLDNYKTIQNELKNYKIDLSGKRQVLVATKSDIIDEKDQKARSKKLAKAAKIEVMTISSQAHKGVREVLRELIKQITEHKTSIKAEQPDEDALPVFELSEEQMESAWRVEKINDIYEVSGKRIEHFARRLDLSDYYSQLRIKDIMRKIGILQELSRQGIAQDDSVRIGDQQFKY